MNSRVFKNLTEAIGVAEQTGLPGYRKRKMVMNVIKVQLGSKTYQIIIGSDD